MLIALALVQALRLLPFATSQDANTKLATTKTKYPDAWFYTSPFCKGDQWSTIFTFKEKANEKCRRLNPSNGCFFMYKTKNCGENKDGDHAQEVDMYDVKYYDGKAMCHTFSDNIAEYNSYMVTTNGCDDYKAGGYTSRNATISDYAMP